MNKIEIKDSYTILHFDEYPILFIGKNNASEVIIGSFINENETSDTLIYFHSIVSTYVATKFLKRKITYLDVLKTASTISVVTKDYNDKILHIEEKVFTTIDPSFLPLPFAMCPEVDYDIVAKFSKMADMPVLV